VSLWEDTGRREGAAPDLARYLEARPDGPGAPWARRGLADIKEELARRMGIEPRKEGGGATASDP